MTVGILSWGATKTLISTLDSYLNHGLFQTDDDVIIFFQQMSELDERIAKSRNIDYFGATENVGIPEGYKRLVERSTGEFFLFLENDWLLLEPPHVHLGQAKHLLEEGEADIIKLRSRYDPGNPLWTRQYEFNEENKFTHLLDSVHWRERPDRVFPDKIQRRVMHSMDTTEPLWPNPDPKKELNKPEGIKDDEWFITSSKYANWSNNPHIAKTSFIKENVLPHIGNRDLELDIQGWWEQQDFKVAQGNGLFKHWRLD